jgi:hypothetical protein
MKKIFSKPLYSFNKLNFCTKSRLSQIMSQLKIESQEDKELRYEDELFYFEKEWKLLQEDKIRLHQDYITADLTDHQQREVDILVERIFSFNTIEKEYFGYVLHDLINKNIGCEFERMNIFFKNSEIPFKLETNDHNPNYQITQDIVNDLAPFIAAGYFSGSSAAAIETKAEVKEEKKEEKPKEVILYYLEINL